MTAEQSNEAAETLIGKVRQFVETLDDDERAMFAVLIGPGVEALQLDEVAGFGQEPQWEPGSLRDRLSAAAATSGLQVVYRPE